MNALDELGPQHVLVAGIHGFVTSNVLVVQRLKMVGLHIGILGSGDVETVFRLDC